MTKKEHNVELGKVREKLLDEVEFWKAMTSRSESISAKLREETSVTVSKLRSELDSTAARHNELLASIRRVFKTPEERKDKVAVTLVTLRRILTMRVALRWRGTSQNKVNFESECRH